MREKIIRKLVREERKKPHAKIHPKNRVRIYVNTSMVNVNLIL